MKTIRSATLAALVVLLYPLASLQADPLEQARDRSSHGEYESAISYFEKSIQSSPPSAAVYFELGQALEKSGKEAEAALAYHRSLLLDPGFQAATDALQKSNARLGVTVPASGWRDRLAARIPFDSTVVLGCVAFWIGGFLFLAAFLRPKNRLVMLSLASLLILFGAALCLVAALGDPRITRARQAMVMNLAGTILYKVPSEDSGEKITTLHQGSTVKILSTRGRWLHIELPGGQRGWCPSQGITAFVPSA
jgi:tetratricopeptide (TPR) repeat protein